MNTQVSFIADKRLKQRVMEKARREGVTLKTLMIYAMKGFVDGKISLGIIAPKELEIEEVFFDDPEINNTAAKISRLLS